MIKDVNERDLRREKAELEESTSDALDKKSSKWGMRMFKRQPSNAKWQQRLFKKGSEPWKMRMFKKSEPWKMRMFKKQPSNAKWQQRLFKKSEPWKMRMFKKSEPWKMRMFKKSEPWKMRMFKKDAEPEEDGTLEEFYKRQLLPEDIYGEELF
jgi:hypothetical protein